VLRFDLACFAGQRSHVLRTPQHSFLYFYFIESYFVWVLCSLQRGLASLALAKPNRTAVRSALLRTSALRRSGAVWLLWLRFAVRSSPQRGWLRQIKSMHCGALLRFGEAIRAAECFALAKPIRSAERFGFFGFFGQRSRPNQINATRSSAKRRSGELCVAVSRAKRCYKLLFVMLKI
jgi:hypothetical protein